MRSKPSVCLCLVSIPKINQLNEDNDAGDLKSCIFPPRFVEPQLSKERKTFMWLASRWLHEIISQIVSEVEQQQPYTTLSVWSFFAPVNTKHKWPKKDKSVVRDGLACWWCVQRIVTQTQHSERMVMVEAINTSQPEEDRASLFVFTRHRKCLTNELEMSSEGRSGRVIGSVQTNNCVIQPFPGSLWYSGGPPRPLMSLCLALSGATRPNSASGVTAATRSKDTQSLCRLKTFADLRWMARGLKDAPAITEHTLCPDAFINGANGPRRHANTHTPERKINPLFINWTACGHSNSAMICRCDRVSVWFTGFTVKYFSQRG